MGPHARSPGRRRSWRLAASIVVIAVSIGACDSGASDGRVEVRAPRGFLDCPTDLWEHSTADFDVNAPGSSTAEAALNQITADLGLAPAFRSVESATDREVVFLFTDADGYRVGRIVVTRPGAGGWFAAQTERCG